MQQNNHRLSFAAPRSPELPLKPRNPPKRPSGGPPPDHVASAPFARKPTALSRRARLQLWLAERTLGQMVLHCWCVLEGGKCGPALRGISRGLRELWRKTFRRFQG